MFSRISYISLRLTRRAFLKGLGVAIGGLTLQTTGLQWLIKPKAQETERITPEERIERLRATIVAQKSERRGCLLPIYRRVILWDYQNLPENLQVAHFFSDLIDRMSPIIGEDELIIGSLLSLYPVVQQDDCLLMHLRELAELLKPPEGEPDWEAIQSLIDHICTAHAQELESYGLTCQDLRDAAEGKGVMASEGANHYAPDFSRVLERGFGGLLNDVRQAKAANPAKAEFYEGLEITLEAATRFITQYADAAASLAAEASGGRRDELEQISQVCRQIAAGPARTFHEAVQLTYFTHLLARIMGAVAVSAGRPDQYLEAYRVGIDDEKATELLACFLLKFNEVGSRQVMSVTIGGLKRDGGDATNPTSYLLLRAAQMARMPYPNITARIHPATSDSFFMECAKTIQEGLGYPSLYNDNTIVPGLKAAGIAEADARDYHVMGCNEVMIPGRCQTYTAPNIVLAHFSEDLIAQRPATFEELQEAYDSWLISAIKNFPLPPIHWAHPDPFASAITSKCVERGLDLHDGGAEYAIGGVWGLGLATAADSLAAIKKLVYEDKAVTGGELVQALRTDFEGREDLRQRLINQAPKFGNDMDYVDKIAAHIAQVFCDAVLERNRRNQISLPMIASFTMHVTNGAYVPATPDGRHAGRPLSDGGSPSQGRDTEGATAVMHSVAKIDFSRCPGGSTLNLKFLPSLVSGERGLTAISGLIRGFFELGGGEVQINVVTNEDLIEAKRHPEEHQDLIVRVTGFCEYFVRLSPPIQDEIISRTLQDKPLMTTMFLPFVSRAP